jgi:hypothetical protein
MTGAGVITTFHERRVLPLMRRARRQDKMVPNVPLEGTVLLIGELDHEEIKKRIKLALGRPNGGFIEMVSAPTLLLLLFPLAFLCSLSIA